MAEKFNVRLTLRALLTKLAAKLVGTKSYPTEAEQERLNTQASSAI